MHLHLDQERTGIPTKYLKHKSKAADKALTKSGIPRAEDLRKYSENK